MNNLQLTEYEIESLIEALIEAQRLHATYFMMGDSDIKSHAEKYCLYQNLKHKLRKLLNENDNP